MRRLVCWLVGHDRMTSSSAHRTCLRCGLRESLRNYGHVLGWEVAATTVRREPSA